MKRAALLVTLFLALPASHFAQQQDCNHRSIFANVVDENQVPVSGLTAENFRGEFQGKPVRIVTAKWDTSPKRIVILLDFSGSMSIGQKNLQGILLVWRFLMTVPEGTQVALITFGDEVNVRSGFLGDRQALKQLAENITHVGAKAFKGRTSLWDAIAEAIRLLERPQLGDALFLATDGGDNASKQSRRAVEQLVQNAGLRFFAAMLWDIGEYRKFDDNERTSYSELQDIAEKGGGAVFDFRGLFGSGYRYDLNSPEGQKVILQAADMIFTQIHKPYVIEIELAATVDKPRSWNLKLLSNKGSLKKAIMYYPKILLPCPAAGSASTASPK
jgi:Mg-chelatase subunit ChlD